MGRLHINAESFQHKSCIDLFVKILWFQNSSYAFEAIPGFMKKKYAVEMRRICVFQLSFRGSKVYLGKSSGTKPESLFHTLCHQNEMH